MDLTRGCDQEGHAEANDECWGALVCLTDESLVPLGADDFTLDLGAIWERAGKAPASPDAPNARPPRITVRQDVRQRELPAITPGLGRHEYKRPADASADTVPTGPDSQLMPGPPAGDYAGGGGGAVSAAGPAALSEAVCTTGAVLWDGAIVCAAMLGRGHPSLGLAAALARGRRCRVLELGAGVTGIPGIVAWHLGADVTLTDLPTVVAGLRENVHRNVTGLEHATVTSLAWTARIPRDTARSATGGRHPGEPGNDEAGVTGGGDEDRDGKNEDEGEPQHDVILAADCIYDMSLVAPLLETITRSLQPRTGVCIASVDTKIGRHTAYALFEREARRRFGRVDTLGPGHPARDPVFDSDTVKVWVLADCRREVVGNYKP